MEGGNRKIHNHPKANSNGFKQNPQNIGGGRKPKIETILKRKGYNSADIKEAYAEMSFYTLDELKEVFEDESKPIIMRIVANQFYQAMYKSDLSKIMPILEQVTGKPKQEIESRVTNIIDVEIPEEDNNQEEDAS